MCNGVLDIITKVHLDDVRSHQVPLGTITPIARFIVFIVITRGGGGGVHAGPTDNQSKRVSSMLCTNKAAQDTQPCMDTTYSACRPPNRNLDPRGVDDWARSPDSVLIHRRLSV